MCRLVIFVIALLIQTVCLAQTVVPGIYPRVQKDTQSRVYWEPDQFGIMHAYMHTGPVETYEQKLFRSCEDNRANPHYCH